MRMLRSREVQTHIRLLYAQQGCRPLLSAENSGWFLFGSFHVKATLCASYYLYPMLQSGNVNTRSSSWEWNEEHLFASELGLVPDNSQGRESHLHLCSLLLEEVPHRELACLGSLLWWTGGWSANSSWTSQRGQGISGLIILLGSYAFWKRIPGVVA